MKKNGRGLKGMAPVWLILGLILLIALLGNKKDSPSDRCIEPGCDSKRAQGSSYCYIHKPYTGGGSSSSSSGSSSSYSSGTSSSTSSAGTGKATSTTSHHSTGKSSDTVTYNELINDPADYDDPEEYADDAWGVDFEDWDEAYDFWEDY